MSKGGLPWGLSLPTVLLANQEVAAGGSDDVFVVALREELKRLARLGRDMNLPGGETPVSPPPVNGDASALLDLSDPTVSGFNYFLGT